MAQFYFSVNVDNDRRLYIAPVTDRIVASSGQEVSDQDGYFLFERRAANGEEEVEILARFASEDAAFRLREMLKMT